MTDEARSRPLVVLIGVIFVVISLLTNTIQALLPDIKATFDINLTLAALLPFAFFLPYGVVSIPAGMVIQKSGDKPVMVAGFALALGGALLFSVAPSYGALLVSLPLVGAGMAALQVAINPLLRVAGGEEHYAFNAVVMQAVFGIAGYAGPHIYQRYGVGEAHPHDPIAGVLSHLVPAGLPWVAVYWILAAIALVMLVAVALWRLPRVVRKDDEQVGALATHLELLRRPIVWAYFIGIFAYVGLEQGLGNWISQFLATYHGYNPQTDGADAVAYFWLLMTIGAALGAALLKVVDSRRVLFVFSIAALIAFTAALFGPAEVSRYSFMATGFTLSVMWSIVFSLALNSLDKHHGTFSGILCTGIVGGAIVPLFIGYLGDHIGLLGGMCFLYAPMIYILAMSVWARPLVANKTIGS